MSDTSEIIDQTRAVRPGEELDTARLGAYLRTHLDHQVGDIEIEQFPGGHSNLTYLIRNGDREYVLRRPPYGSKVKSAHDMSREYRVLSRLAPVFDKAPRPYLFCRDPEVIGADFYLMARVRGVILRKEPPPGITISPEMATRLSEVLIDTMAQLHAIDYQAAGLGDLGRPSGYIDRQIKGWTKRYGNAQTDDIPEVDAIAAWLAENMPADGPPALIHNDFKFDNVILAPDDLTRIIGILDWEMCTLGDPLMDLGTTLCYWVQADDLRELHRIRFGPTHLPGMLTRAQLAERYAHKSGRDIGNILFFYVYGLFKTAVVVQQIYYRFKQGLTKDPRFAEMILGVRLLAIQAQQALAKGAP